MASARVHQNMEWVRSWVENENPDAAAFDFEWMIAAKRIARTFALGCTYLFQRWRMTDWSWAKLGSYASRTASSEIGVIEDQQKAKS